MRRRGTVRVVIGTMTLTSALSPWLEIDRRSAPVAVEIFTVLSQSRGARTLTNRMRSIAFTFLALHHLF